MIRVKRVYEPPDPADGTRILVDRLWPRGINKETAKIDLWLKEVSPSNELRKWYNHEPEKWPEFKRRYYQELKETPWKTILDHPRPITLLYSSRELKLNNAVALKEFLDKHT